MPYRTNLFHSKLFQIKNIFLLLCLLPNLALAQSFSEKLAAAALERTAHQVRYDGRYLRIAYPNGDVPADIGVCTDVVIRSYRALGIDLQQLVHQDMQQSFARYPSKRIWGLTKPDSNIDHRRVPNLQAFFSQHGERLKQSKLGSDYQAGDIVTWMLPGNLPHIGIVANQLSADKKRPLIVHNIGSGPELSDMLFTYPITGHYRYQPALD
ncbi:DUF1287 domain-containing protein [Rheinheimera sp. WS51]|uniref:DUF1287 domain-containing protein n=1 Tax=Rheinheimera sp. WS51 TaxID=3425886 RepID=UPI003D9236BB